MKHLRTFSSFLNETRKLSKQDENFILGIENMERKYSGDTQTSDEMKFIRNNFMKDKNSYNDLSSKELADFNLAIIRCIPGQKIHTDTNAIITGHPE